MTGQFCRPMPVKVIEGLSHMEHSRDFLNFLTVIPKLHNDCILMNMKCKVQNHSYIGLFTYTCVCYDHICIIPTFEIVTKTFWRRILNVKFICYWYQEPFVLSVLVYLPYNYLYGQNGSDPCVFSSLVIPVVSKHLRGSRKAVAMDRYLLNTGKFILIWLSRGTKSMASSERWLLNTGCF